MIIWVYCIDGRIFIIFNNFEIRYIYISTNFYYINVEFSKGAPIGNIKMPMMIRVYRFNDRNFWILLELIGYLFFYCMSWGLMCGLPGCENLSGDIALSNSLNKLKLYMHTTYFTTTISICTGKSYH